MNIEQKLQSHIDLIEAAIIKTRRNEKIHLGALDRESAALCAQIKRGGPNMNMHEAKMLEMINKLDELAAELKDYQHRIKS